jgi:hypothetical protein
MERTDPFELTESRELVELIDQREPWFAFAMPPVCQPR